MFRIVNSTSTMATNEKRINISFATMSDNLSILIDAVSKHRM